MTTPKSEETVRARKVEVTDDELQIDLDDGRRLAVPLAWYPRLLAASVDARGKWELLGNGEGIHWPEADEDLSVSGLLSGTRPEKAQAAFLLNPSPRSH